MKKIFLVDTENVNLEALGGANKLDKEDMIILFVTQMTNMCQFQDRKIEELNIKANVLKIHVLTGRKNSLDFQLVSYLGLLMGEHRDEDNAYYIVSKDKGFLSAINLLENCTKYKISLVPSIYALNILDKCDFLERVRDAGFTIRTGRKLYLIVQNLDKYEDIHKQLNIAFGRNKSVVESLENVVRCYIDEKIS